jgi:hypothetical protein
MSLIRRILNLQHRKELDAEIQAELQPHIEMAVEDGSAEVCPSRRRGARRSCALAIPE